MPAVIKMGEQLFMDDFYDDLEDSPNNELLSTIRVPKNLLYLTDRLPQPNYLADSRVRNRSTEEESKRRSHENSDGQQRLPTIPRQSKNSKAPGKQTVPLSHRNGNEEVA